MIRGLALIRRKLSFTEQELEVLADEFAEYAAEEIADMLGTSSQSPLIREVHPEIVHAIRSVIDELPAAGPIPALQLQSAAQKTLARSGEAMNSGVRQLLKQHPTMRGTSSGRLPETAPTRLDRSSRRRRSKLAPSQG